MKSLLTRWFCTTIAVALAAHMVSIRYESIGALLAASLLLGIANALVRPVLLLLSLPFILVTLGFFILVVNGLLLWMVGSLVPGFHVDGFWQAFFGALIVSVVSWLLSAFFKNSDGRYQVITRQTPLQGETLKPVRGRVIEP
ncbi:MAG: phage holin family protein [Verrucomicrobiota bacterium]